VQSSSSELLTAERLARAFGESCVALEIRAAVDGVVEQLTDAFEAPASWFHQHVNWPCALNDSGLPVEFSLKVEGSVASLRCVVDGTDHRVGVGGNVPGYVDRSLAVAGARTPAQVEQVRTLCTTHLAGVPAHYPSRLVHGLGYAPDERARGSLYFRTGWLSAAALADREPSLAVLADELWDRHGCRMPGQVEVMGYDFEAGELTRIKAYTWLPVQPSTRFSDVVGNNPDLVVPGEIFMRMGHRIPQQARDSAAFLQSGGTPDGMRQRVFFFAAAWGWDNPEGLGELLGLLMREYGVDLTPLALFRQTLGRHDVRMRLSMVAIGGDRSRPSVTFYFLPASATVDSESSDGSTADRARALYATGVRRLLVQELAPTAAVAMLAEDPHLRPQLEGPADRLGEHLGVQADVQADVRADVGSLALATLALARLGRPACVRGLRDLVPKAEIHPAITGTVLCAAIEWARLSGEAADVSRLVARLLSAQREDGGWPGLVGGQDLAAAADGLHALRMAARLSLVPHQTGSIARAVQRGLEHVRDVLVAGDSSYELALWLRAWLAGGGSPTNATVGRAVEALAEQQQPDGTWTGGDDDLVTTAAALSALRQLV
jgi:hypothetical protein